MISRRAAVAATALCLAAVFTFGQDSAAATSKEPPMKTVIAGKFTFNYRIDGANLVARVSCKTNGWIAVGFNPKAAMQGANLILGSVIDGKAVVSDEFGDGMFTHAPDTVLGGTNNIIAGDCTQANGVTTLSFTIPLDSGDPKDVKLVPGAKVKLIFATGATNDIKKKHKDDATKTITL